MIFDLQRFSDTISSALELKVGLKFDDGDTRLITIPNPDTELTGTQVKNAFAGLVTNNFFIGDKAGGTFTGLYTAYIDDVTRMKLDFSA